MRPPRSPRVEGVAHPPTIPLVDACFGFNSHPLVDKRTVDECLRRIEPYPPKTVADLIRHFECRTDRVVSRIRRETVPFMSSGPHSENVAARSNRVRRR